MDRRRTGNQLRHGVDPDGYKRGSRGGGNRGIVASEVVRTVLVIYGVAVVSGTLLVAVGRDGHIVDMLSHAWTSLATMILTLIGVGRKSK